MSRYFEFNKNFDFNKNFEFNRKKPRKKVLRFWWRDWMVVCFELLVYSGWVEVPMRVVFVTWKPVRIEIDVIVVSCIHI